MAFLFKRQPTRVFTKKTVFNVSRIQPMNKSYFTSINHIHRPSHQFTMFNASSTQTMDKNYFSNNNLVQIQSRSFTKKEINVSNESQSVKHNYINLNLVIRMVLMCVVGFTIGAYYGIFIVKLFGLFLMGIILSMIMLCYLLIVVLSVLLASLIHLIDNLS